MTRLHDLLRRSRTLAEIRFVIGGAVVGAAAGLAVAIVLGARVSGAGLSDHVAGLAAATGYGWWGGLFFSLALALTARRSTPAPPARALLPATLVAASVLVLAAAASAAAGLAPPIAVGIGVAAGAVAARVTLRLASATVP